MIWDFIQNEILGMRWLNELIGDLLGMVGVNITDKLKKPEKSCKVTQNFWNFKKNTLFLHFFSKIFGHVKKKQYLCTRFRKEAWSVSSTE